MGRLTDREIEESYDRAGYGFDPEDEALLNHILCDDEPPQGLHRGGFKPRCADPAVGHFFESLGFGLCVYCGKRPSEING